MRLSFFLPSKFSNLLGPDLADGEIARRGNAPETGVPVPAVKRPETCSYTDCTASGRTIKKNAESNKTARTSRAALIFPLVSLLPGPAYWTENRAWGREIVTV